MAKQYGMVIDTTRCMGCQTCAVACKVSNGVPGELYWAHVEGLDGDLYRPTGTFPKVKMNFRPTLCNIAPSRLAWPTVPPAPWRSARTTARW